MDWFWAVSRRRRSGPEAISYTELDAWRQVTRTTVLPEEVEILMRMDDAFLTEVRKEQAEERERSKSNRGKP